MAKKNIILVAALVFIAYYLSVVDPFGWRPGFKAEVAEKAPRMVMEPVVNQYFTNGDFADSFDGWSEDSWGEENVYAYEYVSDDGHGDFTSLKVSLEEYTEGDAKWMPDLVALDPGKMYAFSMWYKADVPLRVNVLYEMRDGELVYDLLDNVLFSDGDDEEWNLYQSSFRMRDEAMRVAVFASIAQEGWLMTDDYALGDFDAGRFERPLLSMMFDDGWIENPEIVIPLLDRYGMKTSHCYLVGNMNWNKGLRGMMELDRHGHEICSHGISHDVMTGLDDETLRYELLESKRVLEDALGKAVDVFVSPTGTYDARTLREIYDVYRTHRGVTHGYNTRNDFDGYTTRVQNIYLDTTADEVAQWVREAQEGNYWVILLYHDVGEGAGEFGTRPEVFSEHLRVIDESGIEVRTYSDALDEVLSQLD